MFCRFFSVPLPRFWCVLLRFVCGFTWVILACSLFCLCSFAGFVDCVAHFVVHFVRVHFALYLWHYQKITSLFCPVLLSPCLFSCFFVMFVYESCSTRHLCPLSWSKWSPPLIIIIVVNMTHFNPCPYIEKNVLHDCSHLFLTCFWHSPSSYTLLYPSARICTHLHTFVSIFANSLKTRCPGKFSRPSGPN